MTSLSLHRLTKCFGASVVVRPIDLQVYEGKLRLIAGLEPPTSGAWS